MTDPGTGLRGEVRIQCDELHADAWRKLGVVLATATIVALVVAAVLLSA